MPQCAMAQFGILRQDALEIAPASGNQKECSSATALLKSAFTAGLQDVWKFTVPT